MGGEGGLIIYFVVPLYFVLLSAPEKGGRVTIKFTSENPRLAWPALLICSWRLAELGVAGHSAPAPARLGGREEGAGAGGRWCESLGPGAQGVREAAARDWRREERARGGEPRETPSLRVPRLPGPGDPEPRPRWRDAPGLVAISLQPPSLFPCALSCVCVWRGVG